MLDSVNIKPTTKNSLLSGFLYLSWFAGGIGFFIPLLIYFLVKDDKYIRFHALQSFLFSIFLFALDIVLFAIFFALTLSGIRLWIDTLLWFVYLLFIIAITFLPPFYFAYLTTRGRTFSLPFITPIVLKYI